MRNLLGELLATNEDTVEVCEIGFNMGHSSLLWLLESERTRVRAFDLGKAWYNRPALEHLQETFGEERIQVVFGDSTEKLEAYSFQGKPCALIFIDGGHTYDTALSDIRQLEKAARPAIDGGHTLLLDDPNHPDVGRAWQAAINDGIVLHHGDVFEDAHHASVYDARAALVYGQYQSGV